MIYEHCLPHNERLAFCQDIFSDGFVAYQIPLALRPRLEYKRCLTVLRVSKQIRSEVIEQLLPHITPFLQTVARNPYYMGPKYYPRGLFRTVRCLEIRITHSILEACSVLNELPAMVEHVKFHFDWQETRSLGEGVFPWVGGLAELLVQRFHPSYKSIDADMYFERYFKSTSQDQMIESDPAENLSIKYVRALTIAIERASMHTFKLPTQIKSCTVVAPTEVLDAKWSRHFLKLVPYDVVSTEMDWLEDDTERTQLLRHKQAIVRPVEREPDIEDSDNDEDDTDVKETFIKQSESVFRNQEWDSLGDLEPTYDICHQ